MEQIVIITVIALAILYILSQRLFSSGADDEKIVTKYAYSRKEYLMTAAENDFFKLLMEVVSEKYYVFPQIHLSALLKNETKGRYWKAAFQRINRTSVDYVLCDRATLKPVYAVELDDYTHDRPLRQRRDNGVENMLKEAGIPLVRFQDYKSLSKENIITQLSQAKNTVV